MTGKEALVRLIWDTIPEQMVGATVQEVNKTSGKCLVHVDDDPKLPREAMIKPTEGESIGSIVIYPKVGSWVVIGIKDNMAMNAFIMMVQEAESITLNGDQYGGLVKIEELTKRLNAIEERLNNHQHTSSSPGQLTTPNLAVLPISKTTKGEIENPVIKHG